VSLDDFKNIQCDILVTSSAIQYLKDWKEGLSNFALLRPKYIFFADVFCGNISTFVSLQNYYESKIPQWFLNQDEFVNTVTSHGFKLLSSSVCTAERNSHFTFLDMSNFPQNLQLKYTRNFLFKANS
jgi:putative methyltransferase (TIGR04325 family)